MQSGRHVAEERAEAYPGAVMDLVYKILGRLKRLFGGVLLASGAVVAYAAPSGCAGDCITITTKEYLDLKVSLVNSERDFTMCSNKLSQNQAANRFVAPE